MKRFAIRKAFQALLNNRIMNPDLGGRKVNVTGPSNAGGDGPNRTAMATRRVAATASLRRRAMADWTR